MSEKHDSPNDKNNCEHGFFESEGQIVNYTHSAVDPIEQQFINLNDTDIGFMNYNLGDANDLLQSLDPKKDLTNYDAKDMDELIFRWNNKTYDFKFIEESQFVNAIGAAFGNYLNKEFDTVWSVVSDEYGNDYACVSTGEFNFQLFPFSSTWKAIEQKRDYSLNAITLIVKKNMEGWRV